MSILQEWVSQLGLRHQGVLLSAVRGCDGAAKDDPGKRLSRVIRGAFLRAHCGDNTKAASFIEMVDEHEFEFYVAKTFYQSMDEYPLHYVTHLLHAAEILAYYHPTDGGRWMKFYGRACWKLHLNIETKEQLDDRLNANEHEFGISQK